MFSLERRGLRFRHREYVETTIRSSQVNPLQIREVPTVFEAADPRGTPLKQSAIGIGSGVNAQKVALGIA